MGMLGNAPELSKMATSIAHQSITQSICLSIFVAEVRPPSKKGTPVVVKFSIFVVDINSINVEDMDFR